jgi:hypothetical protein
MRNMNTLRKTFGTWLRDKAYEFSEKGTKAQNKSIERLFSEIIINPGQAMTSRYIRHLGYKKAMTKKEHLQIMLQLKCQEYRTKKE